MGNILQRDAKYSSKRLSGFRKVQSWAANSMDFYSSSSLGSQNISESADLVKTNQDHEAQGQEFQKTMFRPILRLRLVLKIYVTANYYLLFSFQNFRNFYFSSSSLSTSLTKKIEFFEFASPDASMAFTNFEKLNTWISL